MGLAVGPGHDSAILSFILLAEKSPKGVVCDLVLVRGRGRPLLIRFCSASDFVYRFGVLPALVSPVLIGFGLVRQFLVRCVLFCALLCYVTVAKFPVLVSCLFGGFLSTFVYIR